MPETDRPDRLFGRFTGQSKLKQGQSFIRLTPDRGDGGTPGELSPLQPAVELEGSFGVVSGTLDDTTLFDAEIEEVIPPILSGVLDRMLADGDLDAEALLPKVESSIRALVGTPASPPEAETLCALVVGHRKSARGAASGDGSVTEFDFNSELAEEIGRRTRKARVEIVFRDNTTDGYKRLPRKINQIGPHFIVSLHLNAVGNRNVSGSETLFFTTSRRGHELAKIVQRHVVGALELRDRHTKPRTESERGGLLLRHTVAPCVICEPFFISNDGDLALAKRRQIRLANAYAAAIDEAASVFGP